MNHFQFSYTHNQWVFITLLVLSASIAACSSHASRDLLPAAASQSAPLADARTPLPNPDLTPISINGTPVIIPSAVEFTLTPASPANAPSQPLSITPEIVLPTDALTPPSSELSPFQLTPAAPGQLITRFESSLSQADPGDQITLRWLTVGSKITIYTMSNEGNFVTAWENLPAQGERVVNIEPVLREYVDYVLIVEAGSLAETQTVRVSLRCPDKWFFTDPPDACPQSAAQFTSAVYQPFEHGWMVWFAAREGFPQDADSISVFLNGQNHYRIGISAPWKPGLPESDPALTPPPGLLQPVRGFCLVWRDSPGLSFNLRERIGWATAAEAAYQAGYQCEGGKRYGSCFLSLADGRILELPYAGEGWRLWSK